MTERGIDSNVELVISPAFIDLKTVLLRRGKTGWVNFYGPYRFLTRKEEIDKAALNVDVPETLTINAVETCFQTIEEF